MTKAELVILIVTVAGFYPVLKALKWLWRHNVSGPIAARADEIVSTVVVRELKERDGNGGHNLTDISDKLDHLKDQVGELEKRTQIIRTGSTTPEPLGHYAQDRLHELGTLLAGVAVRVELLWQALKQDYELPDLPTIAKTEDK